MAKRIRRAQGGSVANKAKQGEKRRDPVKDLEKLKEIATPEAMQINGAMLNLMEGIAVVITVGDRALLARMKGITAQAFEAAEEALDSDNRRTH